MTKLKIFLLFIGLIFFFSSIDIFGLALKAPDNFYYIPDTDVNVYYTYIDQAREGRFLFCNQYAVEQHKCRLFFPLWFVAGNLGQFFGISNLIILIATRVILLAVFFYILINWCQRLFKKFKLWHLFFLVLAGGLTSMIYLHGNFFVVAFQNPHNLFVLILILWLYKASADAVNKNFSLIRLAGLFLLALFLSLAHVYDTLILFAVYGLYVLLTLLFDRSSFVKSIYVFTAVSLGFSLGLFYYLTIFLGETAYQGWLFNNSLPLKGFMTILKSYGWLMPFSALGAYLIIKKGNDFRQWFIFIAGLIANWLMLFLPLYVNSKFLMSWHISLVFLSLAAIIILFEKIPFFINNKIIAVILLAALFFYGNAYYYISQIKNILQVKATAPRYFSVKMVQPLKWLKENSNLDQAILASEKWDTFLASQSGLRTFIGSNQVNQQEFKSDQVAWFFAADIEDEQKKAMLKDYGLDFVLFSAWEDELGNYNLDEKDYLNLIYQDEFARIYRVEL